MGGRNKELSKESVLSKEVNQPASPINYVLMVIDNMENILVDDLALTEAELFIKRLFVQGDYKHYADKFQIDRNDLQRILYEASAFLVKKNIPCTIALILKPTAAVDSRDVIITRTGTGASYIINSDAVRVLNELNEDENTEDIITSSAQYGVLAKPQLFVGKLKKEDTLLLCSESLSSMLDLNFMQRTVILSKGPEEVCKKLLHSASGTGRKDNISVAAFNGAASRKAQQKERMSNKTLLLIIIPPLLVLVGFLIYNLTSGSREKPVRTSQPTAIESMNLPPVIKKDTIVQPPVLSTQKPQEEEMVKKPEEKKIRQEKIKPPVEIVKKIKSIDFIVNGSVVMISNWESVRGDISYISWENGIADKKSIHKYADYKSIPSSVKVTYKDNSTKSFKIK